MFRENKGSALLYAIFLVVVFSFLGLLIVNLLSTTSTVSSEDLLSSQALCCSESGKEIAIMKCLIGSCSDDTYDLNGSSISIHYINHVALPDGRVLYTAVSKCTMKTEHIKREIEFKFWK